MMRITAWKFGKEDSVTVKYENKNGSYTLTTSEEPHKSLYSAATDIAKEAKEVLGFNFAVSFSALTINSGEEPVATIILDMVTTLPQMAEIKCPKISRKKVLDISALDTSLPGIEANTIPERYSKHINLNLAIDVFLKAAEVFVKSIPKHERGLFDEEAGEESNGSLRGS